MTDRSFPSRFFALAKQRSNMIAKKCSNTPRKRILELHSSLLVHDGLRTGRIAICPGSDAGTRSDRGKRWSGFSSHCHWPFSLKPHACSKSRTCRVLLGFRARNVFGGRPVVSSLWPSAWMHKPIHFASVMRCYGRSISLAFKFSSNS